MDEELRLIRLVQKRADKTAADTLIKKYYDEIYRYAYRQTADKHTALDLTQGIFIAMLKAIAKNMTANKLVFALGCIESLPIKSSTITEAALLYKVNIFSFTNQFVALFDFTFGQYVLALVGIAYSVGLAPALLALIVSRFSRNLMIATIKIIPVFAGLATFAFILNNSGAAAPFHMTHRFYMWTNIVGIEAIVCVVLFVLSFVAALWVAMREKWVDMV